MQFCALAYNGQQADQSSVSTGDQVILFLVYTPAVGLRLLASPDWRQIVHPSDHAYITSLWADFRGRAQTAPEALLEQASSLSVGPIVTVACGIRLDEYPELHTLSLAFIDLG